MDVKITSVIIGVFLGGLLGWMGHFFKNRAEAKGKINTALFHLLEVWSIIGIAKLINENKLSDKLISEIKKSFPKENITLELEAEIKEGLEQSMPMWLGIKPGEEGQYQKKYISAVSELAPIYPFYAFQLSKNQMVINFLDGVDTFIKGKELADAEKVMIKNAKTFISNDAFNEFKEDLKELSKKSGYINYRKAIKHIERVSNRLEAIPDRLFAEYIDEVIAPSIQAHYDSLDITNPNLA